MLAKSEDLRKKAVSLPTPAHPTYFHCVAIDYVILNTHLLFSWSFVVFMNFCFGTRVSWTFVLEQWFHELLFWNNVFMNLNFCCFHELLFWNKGFMNFCFGTRVSWTFVLEQCFHELELLLFSWTFVLEQGFHELLFWNNGFMNFCFGTMFSWTLVLEQCFLEVLPTKKQSNGER